MRLPNFFIVIVVLITKSCLARILIETHQPIGPADLVNATVKILTSCYENPEHAVGLAGNVPGILLTQLWVQKPFPVTLTDDTMITKGPVLPKSRRKLESFVLIASSSSDLKKILTKIQVSVWWNHLASFLILDWKSLFTSGGCSSALQLLWTAWESDVLNAKVLCFDSSQGPLIYTFNPYTNQAPDSWQVWRTYKAKNNHPWTLFRRVYGDGQKVCLGLDFDKTTNLGGHVIRTSVTEVPHCANGKLCLTAFQTVMLQLLFPALKAKYRPLMSKTFEAAGGVDEKGIPSGMMADVANGISDISLLSRYPMTMINLTILYPHRESGLYAITHYNGYMSQMAKFAAVMDVHMRIGMYCVALINIIFFKYFQRQDLMSAILNLVRITKNEALVKVPEDVPSRIYLASVFLFALVLSGLYQGKLATFLTRQMYRPNVNTMNDLANPEYRIYGNVEYGRFFTDPEFDGRFFGNKEQVCTHHVLEKKMAACVHEKFLLINEAVNHSLHLSREPIVKLYWVFQIRKNWPIEHRVNIVMQRLIEADLIRPLHEIRTRKILRLLEINENRGKDDPFKRLNLHDLDFAFKFLIMGQTCAAVIFVMELGIGRFFLRKLNVRTLIENRLGVLLHNIFGKNKQIK